MSLLLQCTTFVCGAGILSITAFVVKVGKCSRSFEISIIKSLISVKEINHPLSIFPVGYLKIVMQVVHIQLYYGIHHTMKQDLPQKS